MSTSARVFPHTHHQLPPCCPGPVPSTPGSHWLSRIVFFTFIHVSFSWIFSKHHEHPLPQQHEDVPLSHGPFCTEYLEQDWWYCAKSPYEFNMVEIEEKQQEKEKDRWINDIFCYAHDLYGSSELEMLIHVCIWTSAHKCMHLFMLFPNIWWKFK